MKSLWMLRQDEEARCHLRCGLCPILLGVALAITGSALLLAARDFPTAIENPSGLPVLRAVLLPPPAVPPPITRKTPAIVELTLETTETRTRIADGVEHVLWTFNGTVPGPFIRVRVGDIVRVHYRNALGSQHLHSINFHAAGGDGGGGFVTQAAPGHEGEFEFTAFNPGLYLYHCHTEPIAEHMAHGMYGLMLVEPKGGLPKVDREYYVMKGEFYTAGRTLAAGLQPFDFDKLWDERPSYVVWNGAYDALRGKHALRAHVNDTVRLYVGNGGPNLITSFHVVGGIFDRVYPEGGDTAQGGMTERDVQTTQVPSGGATIVELKLHKGGAYWLVDHSYSRLPKGIIGELNADEPGATREPTASEGRAPHQAAAAIASVESAPRPLPWARSGVACHAKGRNAIGLRLTANGLP